MSDDARQYRQLSADLADDLSWLEQHCRNPQLAQHAGRLRLAAALVRNAIGPFLDDQPERPLHLVVVGGAGTGKSTVANFLCGQPVAEANPQAGYTRHPVAYMAGSSSGAGLPAYAGFLGPLQRLPQAGPSNLDEDVYQVRHVTTTGGDDLLGEFIVWDCPDMTTWAAAGYVPRLLEVLGLADVVVFVASDERYNDEVPTQFLRLVIEAGKPLVAVITKVSASQAPALITHFRSEVLTPAKATDTAVVALPLMPAATLVDPAGQGANYRQPLLAAVRAAATDARRRSVRSATAFLARSADGLLQVARRDLDALASWRSAVQAGAAEFNDRYRREYLTGEKFLRFDESLVRLIDLLELPGPGRFVSQALWLVRTPYRLLRTAISRAVTRPEGLDLPEEGVLDSALAAWLDRLRAEALRRGGVDDHPVWKHIAAGFERGLPGDARQQFQNHLKEFHADLEDEVARTSRAIYTDLEQKPAVLTTLRSGKFALDATGVGLAVMAGGLDVSSLLLVPVAAAVSHQLVESLGQTYVDARREETRRRQLDIVAADLSGPLTEWLADWPTTGGSAYERLQRALQRVPGHVRALEEAVTARLMQSSHVSP